MALTAVQESAFTASTQVSSANLVLAIASIVALFFLLWGVWVSLSQLKLWHEGQGTLFDLNWNILRALIIMLLLGFLIR